MVLHDTHTPPPPSLVHSEYSLLDWPQVTPTRGGRNESHFSKCLQNGSRFARVVPLVEARASVRLCAKGDKIPPWSRMSVSALYAIRSLKRSWATCAWRRVQTIVIVVQLQPFPRLSIDVIPSVVFLFEGTITQQLASCLSSATHRPSGHGRREAGRAGQIMYPRLKRAVVISLSFMAPPRKASEVRRAASQLVLPCPTSFVPNLNGH